MNTLRDAAQRFRELGLKGSEANCYNSMGNIYNDQKRYAEAIDAYDQAIERKLTAMWYRNRANNYIDMECYDLAVKDLEQAEEIQPGHPHLFLHRGRIALWQEKPEEAASHFRQAVQLRPKLGEFHLWLALASFVNQQADQGFDHLERGIQLTYTSKDIQSALESLEKIVQVYGQGSALEEARTKLQNAAKND